MKRKFCLTTLLSIALNAAAVDYPMPELPSPPCADTETMASTAVAIPDGGAFSLALSLPATATNNIEVQLGRDGGDGFLSSDETELRIGWECGMWFASSPSMADGITNAPPESDGSRSLTLSMRVQTGRGARSLSVADGETPILDGIMDILPSATSVTNWNMAQLVARGHIAGGDSFVVRTSNKGSKLIVR